MLICSGGKVWDMTDAASCNGLMKHSVEWVRSYVQAVGVRNPHTNPLRMATRQAPLPALSLRCATFRCAAWRVCARVSAARQELAAVRFGWHQGPPSPAACRQEQKNGGQQGRSMCRRRR